MTGKSSYSFIIVPDTQIMTARHPELFPRMSRWIVQNAEALNVKMVLHLGDVVNNGASDEEQFKTAKAALDIIRDANLPLLLAMGNHDYDNELKQNRSAAMFNKYFGKDWFRESTWFGGEYEEDGIENCFATLTIGEEKYLFLMMEFGPRDEVLSWADHILQMHSDHQAIIVTHCYLYTNGRRSQPGDAHHPRTYAGTADANDGEDVWHKLLRRHPNVVGIFSGHHVPQNVSFRHDRGDQGNEVLQSFQNWQTTEHGGAGRLRIVTIDPESSTLSMQVFNPFTDQYEENEGYQVSFPYLR